MTQALKFREEPTGTAPWWTDLPYFERPHNWARWEEQETEQRRAGIARALRLQVMLSQRGTVATWERGVFHLFSRKPKAGRDYSRERREAPRRISARDMPHFGEFVGE